MSKGSRLICIRPYRFLESLPVDRFHISELQHFEGRFLIALAQDWLHLKQRPPDVKFDRRIRSGQPNIREERAKPGIGLNHTFKILIPLGSWNVYCTAR